MHDGAIPMCATRAVVHIARGARFGKCIGRKCAPQ